MKKSALQLQLPVAVLKENRKFVAYTPALDLSTSGNTYKQALARFHEAVGIFFEECSRQRTLNQALVNLGWKKVRKKWKSPILVSHEMQNISVAA